MDLAPADRGCAPRAHPALLYAAGMSRHEPQGWVVRRGRETEERDRFALIRGVAVINWDWLPDLTGRSPEDIRRCLDEHDAYMETQPSLVTRNANEIFRFANEILVGDLVVLPRRPKADRFAAGIVTAPYRFRTDWPNDARHIVDVDWRAQEIRRDLLTHPTRAQLQRRQTVSKLSAEAVQEIQELVGKR
jgi:restriction system protein